MRYLAGDERKAESSFWGGSETVDFGRYKFLSPGSEKYKGPKKASECYKIPCEKMKEDLSNGGLRREGTFTISKDGADTPKSVRFSDDGGDVTKTCAHEKTSVLPDKLVLENQANFGIPRGRSNSDPIGKSKRNQKKVTFDDLPIAEDINRTKERSKSSGEVEETCAQKINSAHQSSRIPRLISNTNVKASAILQKIVENVHMYDIRADDVFEADPKSEDSSPKHTGGSPRNEPVVQSFDTWVREDGVGACKETVSRSNKKGQRKKSNESQKIDGLKNETISKKRSQKANIRNESEQDLFPVRTEPEGDVTKIPKRREQRRRNASESDTPALVLADINDKFPFPLGNVTVPIPTNRRHFSTNENGTPATFPEYVVTARTYTLEESDDNCSGSDPKIFSERSKDLNVERAKAKILLNKRQRRVLRLPALPDIIRERDLNDDLSHKMKYDLELPLAHAQHDSGIESPPSDEEKVSKRKLLRENSKEDPCDIRELLREKAKSRLKELRLEKTQNELKK